MLDTLLGYCFPYLAVLVFAVGMTAKALGWARKAVPLKIRLTPAPSSTLGVVVDVAAEVFFLRSLGRGRKEAWVGAWLFHASLALLLAGHLLGIAFTGEEFVALGATPEASKSLSGLLGGVVGIVLLASVLYLLARRVALPIVRRVSRPSDYLVLLLVAAIIATGNGLRFLTQTDLAAVRAYLAGLLTFRPAELPANALFVVHFALVQVLLILYPLSKLAHSCGIFFTRWLAAADLPGTAQGLGLGLAAGPAGEEVGRQ